MVFRFRFFNLIFWSLICSSNFWLIDNLHHFLTQITLEFKRQKLKKVETQASNSKLQIKSNWRRFNSAPQRHTTKQKSTKNAGETLQNHEKKNITHADRIADEAGQNT